MYMYIYSARIILDLAEFVAQILYLPHLVGNWFIHILSCIDSCENRDPFMLRSYKYKSYSLSIFSNCTDWASSNGMGKMPYSTCKFFKGKGSWSMCCCACKSIPNAGAYVVCKVNTYYSLLFCAFDINGINLKCNPTQNWCLPVPIVLIFFTVSTFTTRCLRAVINHHGGWILPHKLILQHIHYLLCSSYSKSNPFRMYVR